MSEQGTRGRLLTDRGQWFTIELPWRENLSKISCIPAGRYHCVSELHPKLGRVYRLASVPGRAGILIHTGNWAGDVSKGWKSNVEGCILIGKQRGRLLDVTKKQYQEAVLLSQRALTEFGAAFAWAPFELEVTWSSQKL